MKDFLKKVALFGLGVFDATKEKAEALVAEMVKRGEVTQQESTQVVDQIVAKAQGRNTVCHRDSPQAGPEVGLTPEERRIFLSRENPHNGKADGSYG